MLFKLFTLGSLVHSTEIKSPAVKEALANFNKVPSQDFEVLAQVLQGTALETNFTQNLEEGVRADIEIGQLVNLVRTGSILPDHKGTYIQIQ